MQLISGSLNDMNYHLFNEVLDEVYSDILPNKSFVHKVNTVLADRYYVVLKDEKPVARCVSYKNESIRYKDELPFLFGNFESINDEAVVELLFSEINKLAQGKNLIGPISGTTWFDYRIALPSANPIFFTEFYNPPYYGGLLANVGFETLASYKSTQASSYEVNEAKLEKCRKMFEEKGIYMRPLDLDNFERDLELIFEVSLERFKNNFLYAPITKEEFLAKYLPLKQIAHPATIYLVFEKDGEKENCVGFTMSIPNLYNKKQLVMKSAARLPGFKYNGMGTWFNEITKKGAKEVGYEELIVAFLIDDGVSERTFSNSNENELYREYELVIKSV